MIFVMSASCSPEQAVSYAAMGSSSGILSPRAEHLLKRQNLHKSKLPFPWKLHQLLEDAAWAGFEDIISWLPGGFAFRVHKSEAFSQQIMTKYFRQSKFSSFTRQLYIYGFTKIEGGDGHGGYFHQQFTRLDKSGSTALERNTHNDRRLKKHYPEKESNMNVLAAMSRKIVSRGVIVSGEDIQVGNIATGELRVSKDSTHCIDTDSASTPTTPWSRSKEFPSESTNWQPPRELGGIKQNPYIAHIRTTNSHPSDFSQPACHHDGGRPTRDYNTFGSPCWDSGENSRINPTSVSSNGDSQMDAILFSFDLLSRFAKDQGDGTTLWDDHTHALPSYGIEPRSIEEMNKDAIWKKAQSHVLNDTTSWSIR